MEYYKNLSLENIVYKNDEGIECIEQWKDVVGYEGLYRVSDLGRVLSLNYNRSDNVKILKKEHTKKGYLRVCFYKNKIRSKILVHRIIANNFIENNKIKKEVNHINGVKFDNRVENLEWCTSSENVKHSWNNNLTYALKGEIHGMSKLKTNQVLEIRKSELPISKLSEIYKISKTHVHRVITKKTWNHI